MKKNPIFRSGEIIFGSSDKKISREIGKLEKADQIKKIAPRIYTSNFSDPPEKIIRRNIFQILGKLFPGALLSHRSAFEFKPTTTGDIFVTYKYTRKTTLPGIIIRFLKGPAPLEDDNPLISELYASQRARALLENLQESRKPGPESKTLSIPELEDKLEEIARVHGEEELNKTRDKARELSGKLGMTKEFVRLEKIIGALLSSHLAKTLKSSVARARAFGEPVDPSRITLFETLFQALASSEFKSRPDRNTSIRAFRNFAFFESYFSNYIEGTRFTLDEAKEIITTDSPLPARNEDSHDILGTYHIVSNRKGMELTSSSPEELIHILQERHAILMAVRKGKDPGRFKEQNNRAGNTEFVDYRLVRGTLKRGFDNYNALNNPFARATFMMFLISEVHPFLDGNGRIARIMMNADLVKASESKILVPTVFREDYLLSLKRLTRKSDPFVFIKMLQRAHEFSRQVFGDSITEMQDYLENCNAFFEPAEGKILKIKEKGFH